MPKLKREATENVEEVAAGTNTEVAAGTNTEVAAEAEGQLSPGAKELGGAGCMDAENNLPVASGGSDMIEVSDEEYDEWLGEDDEDGGSTPILFISQKEKQGTIGSLICKDMDEEYESIRVVLLRVQSGCIMWPEKFSSDSEPLCKSDDGINPVTTEEITPYCEEKDACLGKWKKVNGKNTKTKPCPYGNWDNGEKPRCEEVTKLLVLEVGIGSMIPYWITVKGFGKTEFGKLNRTLAMKTKALKGRMARLGKKGAKKCLFSFNITTELKEYDAGDHYILKFTDIKEVADELKSEIMAYAFQAKDMNLATQHDVKDDTEGGEE